jgi:hypothetical protein
MGNYNVCAADQCQSDADCQITGQAPGYICAPAGTLNLQARACVYAGCRTDADCTASPGGMCAPVPDSCCQTVYGLYCVYPGGCRFNSDCQTGQYCSNNGTSTSCVSGAPICPA